MPKKVKITAIPPEDAAIAKVIMQRNKDKDWVQRAYNPNRESIQIQGEPGRSTHFMEWGFSPDESKAYVYPTVVNTGNKLEYLGRNAYNNAVNTNTFAEVPMNKAEFFSSYGYKKESGIPIQKYGGSMTSKKKIRITGVPDTMEQGGGQEGYGSALSGTGYNANSYGRANPIKNQQVDTLWRYFSPGDVYSYKPDAYQTKRTIPKTKEMNHRQGETYDVSPEYAEKLRSMGYEFKIIEK